MESREVTQLNEMLQREYDALNDGGAVIIEPPMLASLVMDAIDSARLSPPLVNVAATLQLRQLARAICRSRNVKRNDDSGQESMFDDQLQPRYPVDSEGETGYKLREQLTLKERERIISMLRKEAAAKGRHADALQSETDDLVRRGILSDAA